MPDSNSPYTAASGAPQVLELLRHQLVSVSEDRRRVMLWSAILAAGLLMLLGRVASIPWFLALAPMLLLALWQACLLVRQRRCQAAWENILQKTDNGAGQNSIAKASALAASSAELGARDIPDLLAAIASPSVLIFHGLLLGAVVAGGATHEMSHESETSIRVAKASPGGGGCGCGGGSSASASGERAVASSTAVPTTRPPNAAPTRNFNNVPPRPAQPAAYPTRPMPAPAPTVGQPQPGASARTAMPGAPSAAPIPNPRTASPLPAQGTPIPGSPSTPVSPAPAPAPAPVPAPAPGPSVSPTPAPTGALPAAQPAQAPRRIVSPSRLTGCPHRTQTRRSRSCHPPSRLTATFWDPAVSLRNSRSPSSLIDSFEIG